MRLGGGLVLSFFCFCSLLGVLLHDNDREDIEKLSNAFRSDDVDRRCVRDALLLTSDEESPLLLLVVLLESLELEQFNSILELCTLFVETTQRPDVDEQESVDELRESSSPLC